MAQLKPQLKAFTLLETMIAMALIIMAFGGGMTLFLNVQKSSDSVNKMRACFYVENIHAATKKNKALVSESYEFKHISIEKEVKPFRETAAFIVKYSAYVKSKDKPVYTFQEIMRE